MRATRSGERTAVEAEGSGFAAGTVPTSGEETTAGSPDCENVMEDAVLFEAEVDTGAEDTIMGGRAAAKLLLVCLAVMRTKDERDGRSNQSPRLEEEQIRQKKQYKRMVRRLKQTAQHHTAGTHNTHDSRKALYVTSKHMVPCPLLTSIDSILT